MVIEDMKIGNSPQFLRKDAVIASVLRKMEIVTNSWIRKIVITSAAR